VGEDREIGGDYVEVGTGFQLSAEEVADGAAGRGVIADAG